MSNKYLENIAKVKVIVLDVDGVLTDGRVTLMPNGDQIRRMHTRDGFAIVTAIKHGLKVAIITGGNDASILHRFNYLGVQDVFMGVKNKTLVLNNYLKKENLSLSDVLYMGDDIPDYEVMKQVKVATCPNNAAYEILEISDFISEKNGGEGCVRDIIERVLKSQGLWLNTEGVTSS